MKLPIDANDSKIPLTQNTTALAVTYDTTISTATSVTLNAATTLLEVSALAQPIFMRYQASVSSTLFDEFIQAGTTRHYVVPTGVTVVSFIEQAATGALVLIEK